jgi:hypothetical protein
MKIKEIVTEAAMDVAIQGRFPISAGARSLMGSRWRYDTVLKQTNKNLLTNAVDRLEYGLRDLKNITSQSVGMAFDHVCQTFRIEPKILHNAFYKKFNCSPLQYSVNYKKSREGQPVKV